VHKSKEEAHIDQLRLHALQGEGENSDPFSTHLDIMGVDNNDNDDNNFNTDENNTILLAVVQSALESSLQSQDRYVREAMEANFANGYFETAPLFDLSRPDIPSFRMDGDSNGHEFTAIDTKVLGNLVKEAEKNEETREYDEQQDREVDPGVFITGTDIDSLISAFSLNAKQQLAFRIICNHALGIHPPEEPQLLMGVFGEGGTGKSRLINAI
jgi:Tfp pilus assembly pilus retraction ATPase PilT